MKYLFALPCGTVAVLLVAALAFSSCQQDQAVSLRSVDVDPSAIAFLNQAQAAFDQQHVTQALALADSAATYEPAWAAAPFLRARVFMAMNRYADAEAELEKTVELDPEYRGVWFNRGNMALLQGQYERAITLFEQERDLILSTPAEQKRFYEHLDRETLPAAWIQVGRSHNMLGDVESARNAYQEALVLDSTRAETYMLLGVLYEENGDLDKGLAYARRALELDPQNPEHRYRVGMLLNRTGKPQEAARLLQSVLEENPWHEGANYNLGQVLLRLGEEEAGQYLLARTDTLRRLQEEFSEAQAAVHQQANVPARWKQFGSILLRTGQYKEARRAFSIALHLKPDDIEVQNDMANLALMLGDTLEAVQRYESILARDSTQADVWLNLGVVHAYAERFSEARHAWQTALRYHPGHQEAKAYLVRLPEGR